MNFKFDLLIDGALVKGANKLDVINPATGEVFINVSRANETQALVAVAAAKGALPQWAGLSYAERAIYVSRFAKAVEAKSEELIHMLTLEQGKPLAEARFEVQLAVANLRFHASQTLKSTVIDESASQTIIRQRSPHGVVIAIAPWNFPVWILIAKLGAALMTGNTAIGKPAPTTPVTTLMLGELAVDIFPRGVFQTVIDDHDLAPLLTSHPDVDYVSFTGSTVTGKKVLSSTVSTLKRCTLELGGNDAAIVLDDADIKTVAAKVYTASFMNAGQICFAAKRVFVPNTMMDAFVAELRRLLDLARPGDGMDETSTIGPVQNKAQYDKVRAFIDEAAEHGTVFIGSQPVPAKGYFIPPTVVTGLADDARLVREEQFGPVLPILGYDDIDDMIKRANDSAFGLGASVWTSDTQRGIEVASRIESGTVWVNTHLYLPFDVPFGGAKQSGIGQQGGIEGMEDYTQVRIVNASMV